ncbi:hypothetical protein Droror1_Dr00017379 [Drosera rotundifolia]
MKSNACNDQGIRRFQREENIDVWENLQKAKAEAAIRKLEMKLEEKKSTSMARIMKKLKQSQTIAQEMRSSISAGRGQQISRASSSIPNFYIRFRIQRMKCCIYLLITLFGVVSCTIILAICKSI